MREARFDAFTSMFASRGSRRRALKAIFSIAFLSQGSPVLADPGNAKRKGHSEQRGKGHENDRGQGHAFDEQCRQLACDELPVPRTSPSEFCCEGEFCSCGGDCCEHECFQTGDITHPDRVFCCVGEGLRICGEGMDATCCDRPCDECQVGQSGIPGSYRRR